MALQALVVLVNELSALAGLLLEYAVIPQLLGLLADAAGPEFLLGRVGGELGVHGNSQN